MEALLPNEIWQQIFSYFSVILNDDYRDLEPLKTLTALPLVCRRFHSLAQSLLYRTVLLWGLNNCFISDQDERHVLLAAALANSPELGLLTQEISLAHGNLVIEEDLMGFLGERICSLNMSPGFKEWLELEITTGKKGNGIASFLLALTPNVRLVELCHHKEASTTLPWILGGWINSNENKSSGQVTVANHLHNLRELRIMPGLGQKAIYITYFESVLLHPTLEKLKLSEFDWTRDMIGKMQWPDHPCNLRELHLDKCLVEASTVRHILSRCRNLKALTIEMCDYDTGGDRPWDVNLYEFGNVLRELGQNIVRFELGTTRYEENLEIEGKVGSLQNLTSLKHLTISRNNLVGIEDDQAALLDALPTSLETLNFSEAIAYPWDRTYDEYRAKLHDEICGLVGGKFPHLRELMLRRFGRPDEDRFDREV